jgi:hypothetical protein
VGTERTSRTLYVRAWCNFPLTASLDLDLHQAAQPLPDLVPARAFCSARSRPSAGVLVEACSNSCTRQSNVHVPWMIALHESHVTTDDTT